jgi:putative cardiolipin synthase
VGIDSFLLRMQMAKRAERTLDVQYFLIQSDNTGQLFIEALLAAADRGVRVRVLMDDAGSFGRDAQIRTLAGIANVQLRLFNPFAYRGDVALLHFAEYLGDAARLHYRMHNKLFVVDNEIGIVGGRNVGDEYFQGGGEVEFGDYDIIAAGPIVNSSRAPSMPSGTARWRFPIEALAGAPFRAEPRRVPRRARRAPREPHRDQMPYMAALPGSEALDALVGGQTAWCGRRPRSSSTARKSPCRKRRAGGRLLRQRWAKSRRRCAASSSSCRRTSSRVPTG